MCLSSGALMEGCVPRSVVIRRVAKYARRGNDQGSVRKPQLRRLAVGGRCVTQRTRSMLCLPFISSLQSHFSYALAQLLIYSLPRAPADGSSLTSLPLS